jgi:vacuolar-type H+-ATPase subunit H
MIEERILKVEEAEKRAQKIIEEAKEKAEQILLESSTSKESISQEIISSAVKEAEKIKLNSISIGEKQYSIALEDIKKDVKEANDRFEAVKEELADEIVELIKSRWL